MLRSVELRGFEPHQKCDYMCCYLRKHNGAVQADAHDGAP